MTSTRARLSTAAAPLARHDDPATAPPAWRTLASLAATLAYGGWCLAWLWVRPHALVTLASLLLPCLTFAAHELWQRGRRAAALVLAVLAPLALFWWHQHGARHAELVYVGEYLLAYGSLCAWFAGSLRGGGTPLISRVARRMHTLTPAMVAYTTRLTRAWALYFAAMALLSLLVFGTLGLAAWTLFTTVLSPLSLAVFLVGEHLLRYRWHPEFERAPLWRTLQTWRVGGL